MNCRIFLILIAIAACSWACGSDRPASGPSVEAAASASAGSGKPFVVEVFEVKESQTTTNQLIPAVISVEATAQVLAGRDGAIVELAVQEGASVTKGQVLARLNDDDLRAALQQAELEVERLLVEERQYDAMIKVSRSELDQETALFRDGLTSKRQLDRAQYKLEVATQELERVKLATRVARAKVAGASVDLEKSVIRAPIAGFIARRYVRLGAGVVKNDKMFEISQPGPFEVKFNLPQSGKGRLGRGSIVGLSLADQDSIVARARIRRIDPVADAASNTVGFLADVIGKAPLISGLAVNVHVPKAGVDSTIWIPRSALSSDVDLRSGAARTLFVLNGRECELRAVRISSIQGDQIEISEGLRFGDRVILAAPAEMKPGDSVEAKAN